MSSHKPNSINAEFRLKTKETNASLVDTSALPVGCLNSVVGFELELPAVRVTCVFACG